MMNGMLKKLMSISFILLISVNIAITKENLYMFTDIRKCKSCNNEVLNALYGYSDLFDTLHIDYELLLSCRRSRELDDYRSYYKLDTNLKIVKLTDSLKSLYEPETTLEYFVLTRNDSIIFKTKNLYLLIGYITQ